MFPVLPENCELTIDTAQTVIIDGKIYEIQSGGLSLLEEFTAK